LLDPVLAERPEYDFSTTDRVRHRLWVVADVALRIRLQKAFADVPALYIADGHHRMASSARLAEAGKATDVSPEAWCLAYIVPQAQLYIRNFDRVVTDLGQLDEQTLLAALGGIGSLEAVEEPRTAHGTLAVRTASGWHLLHLPKADVALPPAEQLDCARLSELVLGPLLGIADLRTDPRVRFVPGTSGPRELERLVDSGKAAVAFHLHPVEFAELQAVADSGGIMPPKSTYIEPKLRSGLTVYSLEEV
jgi:uncharacterized protein (DUF1015 family)